MAGTVNIGQDGFYGMSRDGVEEYLKAIKLNCIENAKNTLDEKKESVLFAAIRNGWVGDSEKNFEENMSKLVRETKRALDRAQEALEQELRAVANTWVAQDNEMVGRM